MMIAIAVSWPISTPTFKSSTRADTGDRESDRTAHRREIVLQHQAIRDRLDQRETELDQREQELSHRPKSRAPWVALGAIPAVVLTTITHAL